MRESPANDPQQPPSNQEAKGCLRKLKESYQPEETMLCSKQTSIDIEFLTAFVACNSVHRINGKQSMHPCCAFETEEKKIYHDDNY